MKYTITGDNLQFANLEIQPGETIYSEAGSMVYMSGNINMEAKMRGGLVSGLKRKLTGETFFVTNFHAVGGTGVVAFGGNVPGKIMPLDLAGREYIVQKDSFLAAEDGVEMDIAFQKKLGSVFFGGEGLILQRLHGSGTAFIHAAGDFMYFDLQPGQVYQVSTSNVVGWEASVQYDIQAVGGIKTAVFGGEGLFVTTLRGPGRIILQSLTLPKMAGALIPYLPKRDSSGPTISFG
jgi:uncharacterized protein (TIGR00266 family)